MDIYIYKYIHTYNGDFQSISAKVNRTLLFQTWYFNCIAEIVCCIRPPIGHWLRLVVHGSPSMPDEGPGKLGRGPRKMGVVVVGIGVEAAWKVWQVCENMRGKWLATAREQL